MSLQSLTHERVLNFCYENVCAHKNFTFTPKFRVSTLTKSEKIIEKTNLIANYSLPFQNNIYEQLVKVKQIKERQQTKTN